MCVLKKEPGSSESASCSSTSSPSPARQQRQAPEKRRPAGRTKFRETRHPVFRGVRHRGRAGRWRWVCEVRVPGARACRLWLGTFDAAMLALPRGASACLNFADSEWLLDLPPPAALRTAGDVRRAVARAVERFLQLRDGPDAEDAMSATSEPAAATTEDHGVVATETEASSADIVAAAACVDTEAASPFEQDDDVLCEMGWDLYYASLAEALLMEPPPAASSDASGFEDGDCDVSAGVPLWSY
jgi:hypothetical protein